MRRCGTLLTLLLFALIVGGTSHAARTSVTLEKGIKRSGPQYRSVRLKKDSPELCREACVKDVECKAYTYINPGVQGPRARCLLIKGRIASTERSDCCVSGVKQTRSPTTTTPPSLSGPPARMAAPPVRGSQVAPKVQAGRRSPRPIGTITPPAVNGDKAIYKRKPFAVITYIDIHSGTEGYASYTVPDEYLLVIETISVRCGFSRGEQPELFSITAEPGPKNKGFLKEAGDALSPYKARIFIPLSKQLERPSGSSIWVGTQQVRIYAYPGRDVSFTAKLYYNFKDKKNPNAGCSCSLSGYKLDTDSPSLAP